MEWIDFLRFIAWIIFAAFNTVVNSYSASKLLKGFTYVLLLISLMVLLTLLIFNFSQMFYI